MRKFYSKEKASPQFLDRFRELAVAIHTSDIKSCQQIGYNGLSLFKNVNNVLTHCNTGILATGGNGTALSVIYETAKLNNQLHVFVDETRPLGQGARLTCFELRENNVSCTLLCDNAAGSLFSNKQIDAVIVGADRIAQNGDFANKIGTYSLACLAKQHNVPFYVAAPISTFDMDTTSGDDIQVEFRMKEEVLSYWGIKDHSSYNVYNPAFDVTPSEFVSLFISDLGIIEKPFKKNIHLLLNIKENLQ